MCILVSELVNLGGLCSSITLIINIVFFMKLKFMILFIWLILLVLSTEKVVFMHASLKISLEMVIKTAIIEQCLKYPTLIFDFFIGFRKRLKELVPQRLKKPEINFLRGGSPHPCRRRGSGRGTPACPRRGPLRRARPARPSWAPARGRRPAARSSWAAA